MFHFINFFIRSFVWRICFSLLFSARVPPRALLLTGRVIRESQIWNAFLKKTLHIFYFEPESPNDPSWSDMVIIVRKLNIFVNFTCPQIEFFSITRTGIFENTTVSKMVTLHDRSCICSSFEDPCTSHRKQLNLYIIDNSHI